MEMLNISIEETLNTKRRMEAGMMIPAAAVLLSPSHIILAGSSPVWPLPPAV